MEIAAIWRHPAEVVLPFDRLDVVSFWCSGDIPYPSLVVDDLPTLFCGGGITIRKANLCFLVVFCRQSLSISNHLRVIEGYLIC